MKRIIVAALLLVLVGSRAFAAVRVVTTTPGLAALTKEVGGSLVDVQPMALPSQDPHFVDAKPSLALALNRADLLVQIGLDLEVGWLPRLLVGARNPRVQPGANGNLDCSAFVHIRDVPHVVDRSHGDIHPGGNPHYLTDPRQAVACARGIAQRLQQLDPGNRARYGEQLAAFAARVTEAQRRWEQRLGAARGAPVLAYHQTLAYLSDWLGLAAVGFLEPKPGIPPTPAHVAELLTLGRAHAVRAILQEEYYPDATSKLLAAKLGASVVRLPGDVNVQAGQSYVAYMDVVTDALARALAKGAAK